MDFAFGLTFDPADRPAVPGAMREGPKRWRAFIGGVRGGSHFYDWQSADTFTGCSDAKAAAELEFAVRAGQSA